jgi:glycosyltransferase involved in cell wall biosynthesis
MRILVLSNREPFHHGGAEELALHLVRNLQAAGHEAETMRIPFSWRPYERLIDEMVISRSLRIANVDLVIALKFPVYLAPHGRKIIWLLHQFRQAYDLFDAGDTLIPRTQRGDEIRGMIKTADELAFAEAKSLFALPNAAKRLGRYHGSAAEVLVPPLNDPELFVGGETQPYIFAGGRVGPGKRQSLLIESLRYARSVRLIVAGAPTSPSERDKLAMLAEEHGVSDRVTLDVRMLSRSEIAALANHAIASAYVPIDEDNVGYVTLEAFQAAKPVITTTDSGSLLDIVRDAETGLVSEPTPQAIGAAMSQLYENRAQAAAMGRQARQVLADLDLTWPKTIARLLS